MSIALDIGSHRISSLRFDGEQLVARNRRCVYAVLPDSQSHRQLLAQANVEFITCDDGLLLLGDAAWEHAELFHVHARPLLWNGKLPEHDPVSRQLMATLVEAVLPKATRKGELCALTIPGRGSKSETTDSGTEFCCRIVRLQGYEPILVPSPAALALAELAPQGFTGISLVFGASSCEAALVHRGIVACQSRLDHGGDRIDQQLAESLGLMSWDPAGEKFLDTSAACRLREARPTLSTRGYSIGALRREKLGIPPLSRLAESAEYSELLRSSLRELVFELASEFSSELSRSRRGHDLPQPMSVVCGGGLALSADFVQLVDEALGSVSWSVALQPPRIAAGWPFNTTRGLLIAAELESQAAPQRRAA